MPNLRKVEIEIDRIRRQNDALLVLIIKPDWGYISVDPKLATKDTISTLRNEIPSVEAFLKTKRGER